MLITSRTTGTRKAGTVTVHHDGLNFTYRYQRHRSRRVEEFASCPAGGPLAASPNLSNVLSEIVEQSSECIGDHAWIVEAAPGGWTVRAASPAEAAGKVAA